MSDEIDRTRESLRFVRYGIGPDHVILTARVSDVELAELIESMGYVKRPACENPECDEGQIWPLGEDSRPGDFYDCPSCGGTGFGRLVALDGIDVEALRDVVAELDPPSWVLIAMDRLAAIDQEAT